MTLDELFDLMRWLDAEEFAAGAYNECRDNPTEAWWWLDMARLWRGIVDRELRRNGFEVAL
jgi:hypothetical protein